MFSTEFFKRERGLQKLSAKEIENPELVFQQFFEIDDLKGIKETVWEIFEDLTNRQYKHNSGSMGYDNTLYFFEKLEKIIESAYLLRNM